jgi:hypothetical protein
MDRAQIAALIDESLRAAEASDFALIRRIPSSSKFDFIDHYLCLDPIEKSSLRHSIGIMAPASFGFPINREKESDLRLGATLVTNNTSEFSRVPGLEVKDCQGSGKVWRKRVDETGS